MSIKNTLLGLLYIRPHTLEGLDKELSDMGFISAKDAIYNELKLMVSQGSVKQSIEGSLIYFELTVEERESQGKSGGPKLTPDMKTFLQPQVGLKLSNRASLNGKEGVVQMVEITHSEPDEVRWKEWKKSIDELEGITKPADAPRKKTKTKIK